MLMGIILLALVVAGTLFSAVSGTAPLAGTALLEGASAAVDCCLGLVGPLCFWSVVLELMERSGLADGLSRLLRPLLRRLFPAAGADKETLSALAENVSANVLGLGNAATPAGIRAARGLAALGAPARDELCLLVVLNTASLQLLPTTIASLRAAEGAAAAFDILPAVWLSSAAALAAGLGAAALLKRLWP